MLRMAGISRRLQASGACLKKKLAKTSPPAIARQSAESLGVLPYGNASGDGVIQRINLLRLGPPG